MGWVIQNEGTGSPVISLLTSILPSYCLHNDWRGYRDQSGANAPWFNHWLTAEYENRSQQTTISGITLYTTFQRKKSMPQQLLIVVSGAVVKNLHTRWDVLVAYNHWLELSQKKTCTMRRRSVSGEYRLSSPSTLPLARPYGLITTLHSSAFLPTAFLLHRLWFSSFLRLLCVILLMWVELSKIGQSV